MVFRIEGGRVTELEEHDALRSSAIPVGLLCGDEEAVPGAELSLA
jgi:hypothetical protein